MSTALRVSLLSMSILALSACSNSSKLNADVGFVNLSSEIDRPKEVNQMRYKVIADTASTLGAQGALAWRSAHINRVLKKNSTNLNHIFNFNLLLLPHNVLPPVISQGSNLLHLKNYRTIRYTNKVYQLIQPARFVTTPPTWRDYLNMNYKKPTLPNKSLLPNKPEETIVWNKFLKKGWGAGLRQANDIFTANIARLKRDYQGMMLYRKLLDKSMVVAPVVAQADLGITGNSKQLHIHDVVMRITREAGMQTNISSWTPYLTAPQSEPNKSFQ